MAAIIGAKLCWIVSLIQLGKQPMLSYAEYESHCREAFKPCCISQGKVMLILHRTEKKLADNSQDVDCRDYNRTCGCNHEYPVEEIRILERAEEDCHLCHEAGETRETQRCET